MDKRSLNQKFMEEVSRIKSPEIFVGLARLLGVQLVGEELDEEKKPIARDFVEVFADVVDKFDKSSRKRRREVLSLLREANK